MTRASPARRLAFAAVAAVWLGALGVGIWIGQDIGRAIFG